MADIGDLQELIAGAWWIARRENTKENEKMKKYIVREKITKNIIGIVDMTKDQAKKAQADFIVKEA